MASRSFDGRAFTLFESSFDEHAFQAAMAPAVSEILGGAGKGNGFCQVNPTTDLSTEARALAEYLLRELDFRLRAISTSISSLEKSFKNHSGQMEGPCHVPYRVPVNELHMTPPHDLQYASKTDEPFGICSTGSEAIYAAIEHYASDIASPWLDHELTTVHEEDNDSPATKSNGTRAIRNNIDQMTRTSTSAGGGGMFGISAENKNQLDRDEYSVFQLYHNSGWAQSIAKSDAFGNVTLLVIFLNAIYIGYDADNNLEENILDADLQFRIMENVFCGFFFIEWLVRFCAFKFKCDCLVDAWFKFDTLLVAMMVVETWIFPVALSGGTGIPSGLIKLIRLLRIFRMTKLVRILPELVAMIKGVKVASRAVGSALLMLVVLVYVFGIIMFTFLKKEEDAFVANRFRKLGVTMWTLLIDGVFLDGIGLLSRSLMDANQYLATCLLLLFVLLSALTVMNMLIGVLCEVVSLVASAEKEDIAIRMVKEHLLKLLRDLDQDGSDSLSRNEVLSVLKLPDAMATLENLHVDVHYLLDHLDMFFERESGLAIHQVLDMILMLRGDRPPTMRDLLHRETFNRWKLSKYFKKIMTSLERPVFQLHEI